MIHRPAFEILVFLAVDGCLLTSWPGHYVNYSVYRPPGLELLMLSYAVVLHVSAGFIESRGG